MNHEKGFGFIEIFIVLFILGLLTFRVFKGVGEKTTNPLVTTRQALREQGLDDQGLLPQDAPSQQNINATVEGYRRRIQQFQDQRDAQMQNFLEMK